MSKTQSSQNPAPPAHLKAATQRWWRDVVNDFDFEQHHLRLLQAACESWDRMQSAREVLDRDGISYTDRFGAPRARPEIAVERDAKISFARLVRELALDTAGSPDAPSRPPAIKY